MSNRAYFASQTKYATSPSQVLLIGDSSVAYAQGDQTTVSRIECFQFTALKTGTVERLEFRTNANANPAVTSIVLGIYTNSEGKPGTPLGEATAAGEPATESWITATGLSIPVVEGVVYWLAMLPKGTAGKLVHYNSAAAEFAGTGNKESEAGFTKLDPFTEFQTFNRGPMGFQGKGKLTTTESGQVVFPGIQMIELGTPSEDWTRAAEAGCKVGRCDESKVSLKNACIRAAAVGMQVCYIFTEVASFSTLVANYEQLTAGQKNALLCVDYFNESWPGGVSSKQFTGSVYANKFIAAAKLQRELNFNVPLCMQVRLAPDIGTSWMAQMGTVNLAELTKALEPKPEGKTSFLPSGNWLSSHPYLWKPTNAQVEPTNLGTSGATNAYRDGESNWGFQRFMKEIQYVKNLTGLNVPCGITEYGGSWGSQVGEGNGLGSHAKQAEWIDLLFKFLKEVEEEKITNGFGVKPRVPFVIWYDLYSHRTQAAAKTDGETFGIYYYAEEGHSIERNETNETWKKFKEGASKL